MSVTAALLLLIAGGQAATATPKYEWPALRFEDFGRTVRQLGAALVLQEPRWRVRAIRGAILGQTGLEGWQLPPPLRCCSYGAGASARAPAS